MDQAGDDVDIADYDDDDDDDDNDDDYHDDEKGGSGRMEIELERGR